MLEFFFPKVNGYGTTYVIHVLILLYIFRSVVAGVSFFFLSKKEDGYCNFAVDFTVNLGTSFCKNARPRTKNLHPSYHYVVLVLIYTLTSKIELFAICQAKRKVLNSVSVFDHW